MAALRATSNPISISAGTTTQDINIHNNTIHLWSDDNGASGFVGEGFEVTDTIVAGAIVINLDLTNNCITECGANCYLDATVAATLNVTGGNNLSSDATGDDLIATGAQINKSAANQYVSDTDVHVKDSSADIFDNGNPIADFDNDAEHVDADNWRPQGAQWDIGAFELAQMVAVKTRMLLDVGT